MLRYYFKAIFKESSSRSSCTRFLTKKVKVRKKEAFAFFGSFQKGAFFHHKVLLRTKLTFFGDNQFLNDEIFSLPNNTSLANQSKNKTLKKKSDADPRCFRNDPEVLDTFH